MRSFAGLNAEEATPMSKYTCTKSREESAVFADGSAINSADQYCRG
jgi:hypothetical protein